MIPNTIYSISPAHSPGESTPRLPTYRCHPSILSQVQIWGYPAFRGEGLSATEVGPCAPPAVRKAGRAPAVTGAMAGLLPVLGLLPLLSVLPPRGEWGRDRGEPS